MLFCIFIRNKIIWNSTVNFSVKLKLESLFSFSLDYNVIRSLFAFCHAWGKRPLMYGFWGKTTEERLLMRREIDDKNYKEVIFLRVNETSAVFFRRSFELCLSILPACFLAVDFLFFRIESRRLYVFFYAMPTVTFTLQLSIMFLFGISFQFVFGAAYWLCTRTIVTVCRLGTCGTICHVVSM